MVVVIRYFGGVKLGAGGLVRACAGAAEAVLSAIEVVERVPESTLALTLDFALEQPLRHWCEQHGASLASIDYGQTVRVCVNVPDSALRELKAFCAANGIAVASG